MNQQRHLILGIETLIPGGAEHFAVRIANSMTPYFKVTLVVTRGALVDPSLVREIDKSVRVVLIKFRLERVLYLIERLFLTLKLDWAFRDHLVVRRIKMLQDSEEGVLHTNQFKVDHVFAIANQERRWRHVTTIHGDYLTFCYRDKDGNGSILHYLSKVDFVLSRLDSIVCISNDQMDFFKKHFENQSFGKMSKIYNGINHPAPDNTDIFAREFDRKSFVFGMVARGIPEKGWECAIKAYLLLNEPNTQLLLVGDSDYLRKLQREYKSDSIIFSGFASRPFARIALFDVGLLPSVFSSESLPTVVIEYLYMGKPVIATDIGEVGKMIRDQDVAAGITLPMKNGEIDINDLANAMKELMTNRLLYEEYSKNASTLSKRFDMGSCVQSYLSLYRTA